MVVVQWSKNGSPWQDMGREPNDNFGPRCEAETAAEALEKFQPMFFGGLNQALKRGWTYRLMWRD